MNIKKINILMPLLHKFKLSNNVPVAFVKCDHAQTVAINITVRVGSRHESKSLNGIAHFLEHMAFKGTENYSAQQIAFEFDNIGGVLNACTGRESTSFYARVLPERVDKAFEILSEIIQHSTFPTNEIASERDVILQEIAMCNDTPDELIFDSYSEAVYPSQAFGRNILGSQETVNSFVQTDFKDFVNNHYHAGNIVISIAGIMAPENAQRLAAHYFSDLPIKTNNNAVTSATYSPCNTIITKNNLEQTHFILGFSAPNYDQELYIAFQLLATIFGGGMSSRMFQEIREKRGWAYHVGAYYSPYSDTGLFSCYTATSPEQTSNIAEFIPQLLIDSCNSISVDELNRAKSQAGAAIKMGFESIAYLSDEYARQLLQYNKLYQLDELITMINDVTVNDIEKCLEYLINQHAPSVTALGNKTITNAIDYNKITNILTA